MRHRRPDAACPSGGARRARAHGWALAVLTISVCAAGCGGRFLGYGVSTVIEKDCPSKREHIIGRSGLDVSVGRARAGPFQSPVGGVFFYPDAHHEHIWGAYAGLDVLRGLHAAIVNGAGGGRGLFPSLKVFAGMWTWVESPANSGPMTGLKAGLGAVVRERGPRTSVLLEFESIYLHDFLDSKSASFQTVALRAEWGF